MQVFHNRREQGECRAGTGKTEGAPLAAARQAG